MFQAFSRAVSNQFTEMSKSELFVVRVDNLAEKYLASFPEGTNPMYRKRTVHDCSCCRNFIKHLGKVVSIVNGELVTVWDDLNIPEPFKCVSKAMGDIVRDSRVEGIFRTKEKRYSVDHNYDDATNERHDHFYGVIATRHFSAKPQELIGHAHTTYQVLQRGLEEFKDADFVEVLELIEQNQLYKGQDFKTSIEQFRLLMKGYKESVNKKLFTWTNLNNAYARFKNTAIGSLFEDLAAGKTVEQAVKSYETKVAPMNYKRPTATITQGMVEKAVQTLTDLGLAGSIQRRFAKLSDVSVNEVLFVDNESKSKMKDGISLLLEGSVKKGTIDTKKAIPLTQEQFVKDILPKATSIDVFVENRHQCNFLSLTTAQNPSDVNLFKWDNPFAWSYDGDVTDSVKQRVKAAGGNINCKLRVSLSWFNGDDLDLHCIAPGKIDIGFQNKMGILDVDMNAGYAHTRTPVENLAFNSLIDGPYNVYVHQYRQRETSDIGFAIELEYGGVVHQFSYPKAAKGQIPCFNFTIRKGELVSFEATDALIGGNASKDKWGVKTETLVPVVAVMNSPNHWDAKQVGAKHLIFALKNCLNPNPTRGIYNEYLRGDLEQHRKVFEVLGNKTKCAVTDDQVSGIGFTAGRNDSLTVVVDNKRSYTISF